MVLTFPFINSCSIFLCCDFIYMRVQAQFLSYTILYYPEIFGTVSSLQYLATRDYWGGLAVEIYFYVQYLAFTWVECVPISVVKGAVVYIVLIPGVI